MNTDQELHCIQAISMGQTTYLLPSVCVLDIQPFSTLTESKEEPWLLGYHPWKDKRIPVINLSLGESSYEVTPLTHIMIVSCPLKEGFVEVATLIGQIPRAITLQAKDLQFKGKAQGHLYPVRGSYLDAVVVDLTWLGEFIAHSGIIFEEVKSSNTSQDSSG